MSSQRKATISEVPAGIVYLVVLLVIYVAPAWSHHSFGAEFDVEKPLKLQGVVTRWELINPHSWIHIDVKTAEGKATTWMIEVGSPNSLFRYGFTKDSLPPGSEIIVEGYQAKDGANRAVGARLTFSDGRKVFLGGSAPGANPDANAQKK